MEFEERGLFSASAGGLERRAALAFGVQVCLAISQEQGNKGDGAAWLFLCEFLSRYESPSEQREFAKYKMLVQMACSIMSEEAKNELGVIWSVSRSLCRHPIGSSGMLGEWTDVMALCFMECQKTLPRLLQENGMLG
jgi:hypothetical protein